MKTVPFSMRLDPGLKAALQKLADSERRSLTNYVEARLWDIADAAAKAKRAR